MKEIIITLPTEFKDISMLAVYAMVEELARGKSYEDVANEFNVSVESLRQVIEQIKKGGTNEA